MVEEMRAAIWSACQDPPQGDYALRMRLTYDEAMRAAQAAAAIAQGRIEELRQWALDKCALHHRFASEDEHLRAEHIASSAAYRELAAEIEARAALNGDKS